MTTLRHVTTNSERSAYSCRRKWFYGHVLRLRPTRKERPLRVGGLWHVAMEAYHGAPTDKLGAAIESVEREHEQAIGKLPVGFSPGEDYGVSRDDLVADKELVLAMMRGYDARWIDDGWRVVLNEASLTAATTAPSGNASNAAYFGGIIDKVVLDGNGRHWLVEHKTSSLALDSWRARNDYKPQAAGYAWLLWRRHDIVVDGVVYDLALTLAPPSPGDLEVVKSGKRLAKRFPRGLTANVFRDALHNAGFDLDDEEWYREKLDELERQDDPYFRRELYRFTPDEIDIGRELYEVGTEVRRAHQRYREHSEAVVEAAAHALDVAVDIAQEVGPAVPRNGDTCYQWHRPCEYMGLCRYGHVEDGAFIVGDRAHPEFDATTTSNGDRE